MRVDAQAIVRAVASWRFGRHEVLENAELPRPGLRRGWVVADVAAATVSPTDPLLRSVAQAASMSRPGTIHPGIDFAGLISERGEVLGALPIGTPVIGVVDPRRPEGGAQARTYRRTC